MEPIGDLEESFETRTSSSNPIRDFQGHTPTLPEMQELDFHRKFHVLESIRIHFP